ncbi:MAG: MFS transporter [Eubacteriales bacterium]|nr:MFS transporter [Eubacteriales bacterium]
MKQPTFRQTTLACYLAYITQAIVNNLLPVLFIVFQQEYQISFSMLGSLVLLNFGFQLVVDILAIRFVDQLGYRPCIMAAHLFAVAGLVLLGVLPGILPSPYLGLVIAVMVYAIGGGLIEVLVSPIVDAIPGDAKASSMSLLHSFYCWGQVAVVLVSTLALRLLGHGAWRWLPIAWALLPLCTFFFFTRVPLLPPVPAETRMPLRKLLTSRMFVVAMVLMICAGASEQAMSQWSSLFAEKGLQVPKVVGDLLGPCLFGVMMGTGRALYGVWGHKLDLTKSLLACAVLCIGAYLITSLVPHPFVALLGCALCGFAVSLLWPGVFSYTSAYYPLGGTALFGTLAVCGDLGCALGPWVTGVVSDAAQNVPSLLALGARLNLAAEQVGLKSGLLAATLFPLMLLGGIALMRLLHRRTPAQ